MELDALIAEIRSLADEQARDRRARKPAAGDPDDAARRARLQSDGVRRAVLITTCLNLHHELRGSAHRHRVRPGWEGWSASKREELMRR